MCGITGYFCFSNSFNPSSFSRANNIIRHRGPDDFGFISIGCDFNVKSYLGENLEDFDNKRILGALGFRRLSIIDLSESGHQPMSDFTGNYWIVFNGEIYNYIELREVLLAKGYKFLSNTDTEIILNAYREWGVDCLRRFNGMWSFCLFDKTKKKLFCARDRMGIKPFYYFLRNDVFAFGSEIKQLQELFPGMFQEINRNLAFDFLALSSYGNETRETYFNNIFKLNGGCYLELDLSGKNKWEDRPVRWWDISDSEFIHPEDENAIFLQIRDLFEDSIKLRLRSDVPVGTALSGGLDSSGIVSMVDKIVQSDPARNKVFTITNRDKKIDDTYFANALIKEIPVTSFMRDFEDYANIDDLGKFIWHQEEPLQNTSIFGSWQLYKFFSEMNVTVALDGQGADEFMGGYYKAPYNKFLFENLSSFGPKSFYHQINEFNMVHKINKSRLIFNSFLAPIVELSKLFPLYYAKKTADSKPWLEQDFFQNGIKNSHLVKRDFYDKELNFKSLLKKESYELIKHTNLPGILRQVDRNSMAFSIESRLPFLDYRFVELLFSLPVNFMIRDGYTKFAFRKAMENILPEKILWRRTKVGFKMPEFELLKNMKGFIKEHLTSLHGEGFIDVNYALKNIDSILSSQSDYNNIIWRILIFSIWKNKFNLS